MSAATKAKLYETLRNGEVAAVLGKIPKERSTASKSREVVGLVLVLLNQMFTVASSELMQFQEEHGFNGPYFSVYFAHSVTGLFMFLAGVALIKQHNAGESVLWRSMTGLTSPRSASGPPQTIRSELLIGFSSLREAVVVSLVLVTLWKYNIFWSAAMTAASVTVFTSISQSACVIVMVLSVIFLKERITAGKLVSLLVCMGGVVLVSLGSSGSSSDKTTALGLFFTVLCTVFNAVYCVEWGRKMGSAGQTQVCLFLGLMGAVNLLVLWPPLLLVGGPSLSLQVGQVLLPARGEWPLVIANTLMSVAANFTLMIGISFTSPMFVMVGCILQLPMSAVTDMLLHDKMPLFKEIVGYVLITTGFLVLVYEQHRQAQLADGNAEDDEENARDCDEKLVS